jgi:biotin synthetase
MSKTSAAKQILEKALHGKGITPEEANILMNPDFTDLNKLMETANQLTLSVFSNKISMCAIYPAKIGLCSGDCAFCSQSAHHNCDISPVNVSDLNENEIIENAKNLWKSGVSRYSLVTSGEYLTDTEFDHICQIFTNLGKETKIGLCASLGGLTAERANKLKSAGVSRYHHNIETSRSYFPKICSTHSYDDKIKTIGIARRTGMEVCSGGIIALGETAEQRVEMAFALKDIDIDCVPINILNPIAGTRLENQSPLSADEILRTISVFRLILPHKTLRFAGGREKALGSEEYRGYTAGINSMLVGNYLTTQGKAFEEEIHDLKTAGYSVK